MTVHAITVTWRGVWLAMLMAATVACGSSPTAPDDGTTVVLGQQQTTTVTGTDLRITAFTLGMPEAILCLAVPDSPCGQSPAATLRVEIPGAEAQNLGMQVPGPVGANDRFTYQGYTVRLARLEPAWNPDARVETAKYRLVLVVTRE